MGNTNEAMVPPPPDISAASDANVVSRRIRLVEEKATNLNGKIEILESNLVRGNKKRNETLRAFDADLLEMKRDIENIKQKVSLIIRELKMTAGKDELNMVNRYLDLWDLTRFVTRNEIDSIVAEKVAGKLRKIK